MGHIVVGVDGSDQSKAALLWAVEEAGLRGAIVRAVYAWSAPYVPVPGAVLTEHNLEELRLRGERMLETVTATVDSKGVEVECISVAGGPAPVLVEAAKDADLLVVGSRGRGGFAGLLLGSVSQQCAHHARCPVVIVRV
jgi:nucleotide-binding universal stress UspA family protein